MDQQERKHCCKVAIEELKSNHIKIVLTRPVVPVEDENWDFYQYNR